MAFFWHCAGVLARIALASLPASSCPCCRRCTGVVAKLALKGPAGTALAFAGIVLAFCPHCAGIITSIMLLLLFPALRRHCGPWHVGIFALIARPLWWRLPFHCHCRTWCPSRIRCHLRPSSIFCCLTPLQQCSAFCHDIVVGAFYSSCRRLGHNHPPGNSGVCRLELFFSSHQRCRQHHELVSAHQSGAIPWQRLSWLSAASLMADASPGRSTCSPGGVVALEVRTGLWGIAQGPLMGVR